MAEQSTNKGAANLWFSQSISDTISGYPAHSMQNIDKNFVQTRTEGQLVSDRFRSEMESIERNHFAFFDSPFDFRVTDPLLMGIKTTLINDHPCFATIQISSQGIFIEKKSQNIKPDVFIGDLWSYLKIHPSFEAETENKEITKSASVIARLINAVSENAIVISVPDNIEIDNLIQIEVMSDFQNAIVPVHVIAYLGQSSKANLSIDFISSDKDGNKNIIAIHTDYFVNVNAQLNIFRHQALNGNTLVLLDDVIKQSRSSKANYFNFDEGAKGLSSKLSLALTGEGAEASITGVFRPLETSRYYYDTEQIHAASFSESDLLYDGVIGEGTYASWKGNIVVEKGTKGTNGYQANKNLIIHETGKVESVPGLEINTDDVRCSHGVTISNIDKNHMFYLQSRGINEEEAEALIINGFIHSSINRIKTDVFTDQISRLLGI